MAKVDFRRVATNAEINNIEVKDGQFIVTGEGKSFIDYNNRRIPTNGTPDTEMSDTSTNSVENKIVKKYVDDSIEESHEMSKGLDKFSGITASPHWYYIGDFNLAGQGRYAVINCYTGMGQNGIASQNTHIEILLKQGWTGDQLPIGVTAKFIQNYNQGFKIKIKHNSQTTCSLYIYLPAAFNDLTYNVSGSYISFTNVGQVLDSEPETDKEATYYTGTSDYSTDEIRVGTWLGKTLYQRVVYISSLPNNNTGYYDIFSSSEIGNIDVCFIDEGNSYMTITSGHTETNTMNWIFSTTAFIMTCIYDKQIRIITKDDKSTTSAYVTVKYTKTTD